MRYTVTDNKVYRDGELVRECASHLDALKHRVRMYEAYRTIKAEMIEPDDKPNLLAGAVDACVDTAISLMNANDLTSLPGWAQQICSLVVAADAAIDELLEVLGIPDPDEEPEG